MSDALEVQKYDSEAARIEKEIAEYEQTQGQYGTASQQALAGLEGFGRGATLGASDYLAAHLSSPEAVEGRKRANPVTAELGNIGGGAGLIALTGGVAAPIEGALGATTAAHVLGVAAEGAAMGFGNAISEHALGGNPSLNAEKVLSHIGMGAAIGGGLGVLSKTIGTLPAMLRQTRAPDATRESAEAALAAAGLGKKVPLTEAEQATNGALRSSFPIEALAEEDRKPILDGLNDLKPHADEVIAAGQKLGAPTPEGMLTNSEHIQRLDDALTKSPSPAGIARNQLYQEGYKKASDAVSQSLGEGSELSLAQAGNQAKELLSARVEERYAPIKKIYSELDQVMPEIPISRATADSFSDDLYKVIKSEGLVKGRAEHSFVESFADAVKNVDNLRDLKKFREVVNREAQSNPETKFVAGIINDKLEHLELSAVQSHAKDIVDPALKDTVLGITEKLKEARSSYGEFRDEIGKIGKTLWGGKRIYGAQDFLRKIEEETPEKFASRLFSKDNSRALEFMNERFPEVTQLLSQFERSKIRSASLVKGEFSPTKALAAINKLSPEVKSLMFSSGEREIFDAGQTYFDNFLKNFNPSGTAGALQYHEFLKHPIASTVNWAKDFGAEAFIKHSVKLNPEQLKLVQAQANQASKLNQMSGMIEKTAVQISRGVKDIFSSERTQNAARTVTLGTLDQLSDSQYNKHVQILRQFSTNPQMLMDHMANSTEHLYEAAPEITQGIHNSVMNAVQYLSTKIPQDPTHLALSPNWQPNRAQKLKFNQYFNAVNNPVNSLKEVAAGTLTNETMEALTAVHPQLLQEMREQVLSNMKLEKAKVLPYAQKIALSKFLGQPLDANLLPQAIQANQASFNLQLSQQSAPKEGRKTNSGGLGKIKLSTRTATMSDKSEDEQ